MSILPVELLPISLIVRVVLIGTLTLTLNIQTVDQVPAVVKQSASESCAAVTNFADGLGCGRYHADNVFELVRAHLRGEKYAESGFKPGWWWFIEKGMWRQLRSYGIKELSDMLAAQPDYTTEQWIGQFGVCADLHENARQLLTEIRLDLEAGLAGLDLEECGKEYTLGMINRYVAQSPLANESEQQLLKLLKLIERRLIKFGGFDTVLIVHKNAVGCVRYRQLSPGAYVDEILRVFDHKLLAWLQAGQFAGLEDEIALFKALIQAQVKTVKPAEFKSAKAGWYPTVWAPYTETVYSPKYCPDYA